jgi:hypothetical protein
MNARTSSDLVWRGFERRRSHEARLNLYRRSDDGCQPGVSGTREQLAKDQLAAFEQAKAVLLKFGVQSPEFYAASQKTEHLRRVLRDLEDADRRPQ